MGKDKTITFKTSKGLITVDRDKFFFDIGKTLYSPYTVTKSLHLTVKMGRADIVVELNKYIPSFTYTNKRGYLEFFYQDYSTYNKMLATAIAISPYLPRGEYDPDEIARIITNLVTNEKKWDKIISFLEKNTTEKFKVRWKRFIFRKLIEQELRERGFRSKYSDKRYLENNGYIHYKNVAFPVPFAKKKDSRKLFEYIGITNITKIKWKS